MTDTEATIIERLAAERFGPPRISDDLQVVHCGGTPRLIGEKDPGISLNLKQLAKPVGKDDGLKQLAKSPGDTAKCGTKATAAEAAKPACDLLAESDEAVKQSLKKPLPGQDHKPLKHDQSWTDMIDVRKAAKAGLPSGPKAQVLRCSHYLTSSDSHREDFGPERIKAWFEHYDNIQGSSHEEELAKVAEGLGERFDKLEFKWEKTFLHINGARTAIQTDTVIEAYRTLGSLGVEKDVRELVVKLLTKKVGTLFPAKRV